MISAKWGCSEEEEEEEEKGKCASQEVQNWTQVSKKEGSHKDREAESEKREEDRRQNGERSPPSGNLKIRKRDSMRARGWQRVCVWQAVVEAGTHLGSYSAAKNTAGDVGVNPCTGCVPPRPQGE